MRQVATPCWSTGRITGLAFALAPALVTACSRRLSGLPSSGRRVDEKKLPDLTGLETPATTFLRNARSTQSSPISTSTEWVVVRFGACETAPRVVVGHTCDECLGALRESHTCPPLNTSSPSSAALPMQHMRVESDARGWGQRHAGTAREGDHVKGELLTVAVSGVDPEETSQSAVGIARGLRRVFGNRMRIIGLSRSPWRTPAGAEHEFDLGWGIGDDAEPGAQLGHILDVDARFGIDVMIPSQTIEAQALLGQREVLRASRIAAVVPRLVAWTRAVNPGQRSVREIGMRSLEAIVVTDEASATTAVKTLGLPVVVKSTRHTEVVPTLEAALATSERLRRAGEPIALQKYLGGDEYNVAVVRDGVSGHCASVTLRKTLVTRFGQVWAGVTAADRDVCELAERATAALDWHGPCELDIVKDKRGGFWLREFVPRLPVWHEMGVPAGVNLSLAVFYLSVGRRLRSSPVGCAGIYYAHRATDLIGEMNRGSGMPAKARAGLPAASSYV